MNINIKLSNKIIDKIEQTCEQKLSSIIDDIIMENIDEIVTDVVKKHIRSVSLMYVQSSELKSKLMEKIKPIADELLKIKEV